MALVSRGAIGATAGSPFAAERESKSTAHVAHAPIVEPRHAPADSALGYGHDIVKVHRAHVRHAETLAQMSNSPGAMGRFS